MKRRRGLPLSSRFWANVDASAGIAGCWPWASGRDADGYGRLKVAGQHRPAHRIAWELQEGPIPNGMHVLHRCDNPPCVNPSHLWLGTNADNVQDRVRKGRSGAPLQDGEANPAAKLTEQRVREIRRYATAGWPHREIASRFGIHQTNVSRIVSRVTWRHVV